MPRERKDLNIHGANLWYLVGLITSDGCLSKDGRHIDITSAEYEYLDKIKDLIGVGNRIGIKYGYKARRAFRFQIANRNFYEFLLSVGLTQNKSLSLGPLHIRKLYFNDFLRGLIDGDGSIRKWIHPTNDGEQWSLRIYSGSCKFLMWLADTIEEILGARGKVHNYSEKGKCSVLKFGKLAAQEILRQCYYPGSFGLERKDVLADECVNSFAGWSKSKTTNFLRN